MRAKVECSFCLLLASLLILSTTSKHCFANESVETTRISTGIVFQRIFINSSGHHACIFGQPPRSKSRITTSISGPPQQIVVINLQKGEVVSQSPSVGEIRTAFVDEEQILWSPVNTNLLYRLRFNGSGTPEKVVLDASVEQILGLGPELFGIVSADGLRRSKGVVSIYERKTLLEVKSHPLAGMPVRLTPRNIGGPIVPLGDSMFYLNGRVVNSSDGTNRCFILRQNQLPRIDGKVRLIDFPSHDSQGDTYWRRTFKRASEVKQFAGTGQIRLLSSWNWISQTHPLLVSLGFIPNRRKQSANLYLELQDLIHGQVLKRVELPDPIAYPRNHRPPHQQTAIRIGGSFPLVVTVVWDEVLYYQVANTVS